MVLTFLLYFEFILQNRVQYVLQPEHQLTIKNYFLLFQHFVHSSYNTHVYSYVKQAIIKLHRNDFKFFHTSILFLFYLAYFEQSAC